ncbi:hypothetical protein BJX99DRAFT_223709 [Aspergillus californicus]
MNTILYILQVENPSSRQSLPHLPSRIYYDGETPSSRVSDGNHNLGSIWLANSMFLTGAGKKCKNFHLEI